VNLLHTIINILTAQIHLEMRILRIGLHAENLLHFSLPGTVRQDTTLWSYSVVVRLCSFSQCTEH